MKGNQSHRAQLSSSNAATTTTVPPHRIGTFLDSIDFTSDAARTTEDSLARTVNAINDSSSTAATPNSNLVERHRRGQADWILRAAARGMSAERQPRHRDNSRRRSGRSRNASTGNGHRDRDHDASGLTLAAGFHMVPAEDVVDAVLQPASSLREADLLGSRPFRHSEPTSAVVTPVPRLGAAGRGSSRSRGVGTDFAAHSDSGGGHGGGGDQYVDRIAHEVDALQQQYNDGLLDLRDRELGLLQKLQQLQTLQVCVVCVCVCVCVLLECAGWCRCMWNHTIERRAVSVRRDASPLFSVRSPF